MLSTFKVVLSNWKCGGLLIERSVCSGCIAAHATKAALPQQRLLSTESSSNDTKSKDPQHAQHLQLLMDLVRRPAGAVLKAAGLAAMGAAYRDLALVAQNMYDKDVRGLEFPEVAAVELADTKKMLGLVMSHPPSGELQLSDASHLRLHLLAVMPELHMLLDHTEADPERERRRRRVEARGERFHEPPSIVYSAAEKDAARVTVRAALAQLSEQDRLIAEQLLGNLLTSGAEQAALHARPGSGMDATGQALQELANSEQVLGAKEDVKWGQSRVVQYRYPLWDVSQLEDAGPNGLKLREDLMRRLSCWQQLLPNHLEVSYQLLKAIPLFPPREAVYPTYVDFDLAIAHLRRYVRRIRKARKRKPRSHRLLRWC